MPYIEPDVTPVDKRSFTVGLVAWGGDKTSVSLSDYSDTVTEAQLTAVAEKLGALTNAGVYSLITTSKKETSVKSAVVFDEAYPDASMKAVMVYQNLATLKMLQIGIPAPDASMFSTTDPNTVVLNADVIAFNSAVIAVLMAGGDEWQFVRGYRAGRTRYIPKTPVQGTPAEPGATDKPGDAPAL